MFLFILYAKFLDLLHRFNFHFYEKETKSEIFNCGNHPYEKEVTIKKCFICGKVKEKY